MTERYGSREAIPAADIELAGSLQAVLNETEYRDFQLDIQQREALESIGHALLSGKRTGYIEMATSTGKTAVEAMVAEAAVRSGRRVIMLAPKVTIARQLSGYDSDTPTGLARFTDLYNTVSIGHHYGKSRAKLTDQLVISTYAGFLNNVKNDHNDLGSFDVVIGDECHRSLGIETSAAMTNSYPSALKLGFSATPDFARDRMSEEVFGDKLFEFALIDAIESGKTAPLRTLIYETNEKLELSDARAEFTERELAPFIKNMQRNSTALRLALDLVADGRQGIISCIPGSNNVHARLMADMFRHKGIRSADIGTHLSLEDQITRLKQYQNGDIDVLTFTRSLEEGWDSENTSFCINMAPTASPVRTKQLIGRLLRRNPDGRESIYVDFVDKSEGVYKEQYTAMHALELETVAVDRILGRSRGGSTKRAAPFSPLSLSPDLYERLLQSNGKMLSEITTAKKKDTIDPLVRHWERVLEKEGLPGELPYNIAFTPRLEKEFEKAYRAFVRDNNLEPTARDIIELLPELSDIRKQVIGQYGIRATFDSSVLEIPETGEFAEPHDEVVNRILHRQLKTVLETLGEREEGTISLRFGLADGEEKPTGYVSRIYGVTPTRISQVEATALSKLRHPTRSDVLRDYYFGVDSRSDSRRSTPEVQPRRKTLEQSMLATFWDEESGMYRKPDKPILYRINEFGENLLDGFAVEETKKFYRLNNMPHHMMVEGPLEGCRSDLIAAREKARRRIETLDDLPVHEATFENRIATITLLESRIALFDALLNNLDYLAQTIREEYSL